MNVGITGHRKLENSKDWLWVDETMRCELARFASPLVAVTCLAAGADQLFATLVLALGGRVLAILPFADYERTFTERETIIYRDFLAQAEVETLQTSGSDEDAYLAAGCRVAELSDVLFAVWDGRPARGKGGTADVVEYAKQRQTPCVCFDPIRRKIFRESTRG